MDPHDELREILGHMTRILKADREIGLDPPFLSGTAAEYLAKDPCGKPAESGGSGPPQTLESLRAFIGECTRCRLHRGRNHLVFGEGNPNARLVFVGEGPGREEDLVGRPFVGEAGKLLTRIIEGGMRLTRKDVYICNVVKCRPPGNRDPEKDEIAACRPFLEQQIRLIRPEVICILGRVAGRALLGGNFKISKERGAWRSYLDIPVMPTYHPAYLLRNPSRERELKRLVWEDVKKIMKRLGLEVETHA